MGDIRGQSCVKIEIFTSTGKRFYIQIQTNGHTECDAIIMDRARILAIPQLEANDIDAALVHEAAIGKIAGDQIMKLMTLGLSEKQAEEQIINGFLS